MENHVDCEMIKPGKYLKYRTLLRNNDFKVNITK